MINDYYQQKDVRTQMTKRNKIINNRCLLSYFKKQQ